MRVDRARAILEAIAAKLETGGEHEYASLVRDALAGSEEAFANFFQSNTLLGGAGSIADSPFTGHGRSLERKELEILLIRLGNLQLKQGNFNPRTPGWVAAFEQWHRSGI